MSSSTPVASTPLSVAGSSLTTTIPSTTNVTTIFASEAITFDGNASSTTTIAATTARVMELATSAAAPESYSYYDCCLPVETGWITVGFFIFITLLILAVCLFGMYHLRKRERKKCKAVLKQYNDDYHQNSKTRQSVPSAIVTSESKTLTTDNPRQAKTDEKSVAEGERDDLQAYDRHGRSDDVLAPKKSPNSRQANRLKSSPKNRPPGRHDVVSTPKKSPNSRQVDLMKSSPKIASKTKKRSKSSQNSNGLKSSPMAKRSNTRNLSTKSKQKVKEKKQKLNKKSKKGSASMKKVKTRLFQTKSKSGKKPKKRSKQSKPSPQKKKPEARKASTSSNPRRSKDRVVFHEGKHHRLK